MTFHQVTTLDTLLGNLSVETVAPCTCKATSNSASRGHLHGFALGSLGLTSKLEGVPGNKLVIIHGRKIQELLGHLNSARGKLEELGREMTLLKSNASWMPGQLCQKCGTNISNQPCDTTEAFKSTKRPRLDIEPGRLKYPSIGEILGLESPEDAWKKHQELTGRLETSGGMGTRRMRTLSSMTSTDGYLGTSCFDCSTDIPWTSMQREEEEEWWLEGSL